MGLSGADVDRMEPWMLAAACTAYNAANTVPTAKAPTDEEFRAAVARTVQ
jgi:hypothetical protein